MKQLKTKGIVLSRTDYGEADRIITFLTPDHGKVRVMAKGVRKSKSKLAGGIELFSVSDICFVVGRGELRTLTSTRLVKHYGGIVKELGRTNTAYELIKVLNKATEDHTEPAYFDILEQSFKALDDVNTNHELVKLWFDMQILKLAGHSPNLQADSNGAKLKANQTYDFNIDQMSFVTPLEREGAFNANHIKFLRLMFADNSPQSIQRIQNAEVLTGDTRALVRNMLNNFVHI